MASINWKEVKENNDTGEGDYPILPANDYNVDVAKATAVKTKNGKDMIKVQFKVQDGPHKGTNVFTNLVVSPESPVALAIFFRQIAALGGGDILEADGSMEQAAAAIVGSKATVKVVIGEYQGSPKNEVKDIKAADVVVTASGPSPF